MMHVMRVVLSIPCNACGAQDTVCLAHHASSYLVSCVCVIGGVAVVDDVCGVEHGAHDVCRVMMCVVLSMRMM